MFRFTLVVIILEFVISFIATQFQKDGRGSSAPVKRRWHMPLRETGDKQNCLRLEGNMGILYGERQSGLKF